MKITSVILVVNSICISCTAQSNHMPRLPQTFSSIKAADYGISGHGLNSNCTGGYVVGNFGISAQIDETDGPHAWVKVNPPKLGVWLQNFAQGELWIRETGLSTRRLHLSVIKVSRLYPEYEATFDGEGKLKLTVNMFAPLSIDSKIGFLPGLIIRTRLTSYRHWNGAIGYTLTQATAEPNSDDDATPWPEETRSYRTVHSAGAMRGPAFVGITGLPTEAVDRVGEQNRLSVSTPITVGPNAEFSTSFIVGSFDTNGFYAREAPTAESLIERIASNVDTLHDQLQVFEDSLPRTGDSKIDEYLRWYASAGILLTKADRDGDVLTMGYRELNQRDSFWTSGIHLVFWKDLEKKMILEGVREQLLSGRVPTTILPQIDRGDEIDSSEYFILRVARYYRWYRDDELLHQAWRSIQKAIDYLVSRDTDHVGVPLQLSYWADWKDVPGVQGRKYAPHFAVLWLAVLKSGSELAVDVNDPAAATRYKSLQDRAAAFINRPFQQGGLWNGSNYADQWADGRRPKYVLEDQVIGSYFDVIPEGRLKVLYRRLNASETQWGVRETFPYISGWTEETGGQGGNYHNGGIWPWLNFADAKGRYTHGHADDAERIIREVGHADLDAGGDEKPGEYLNGDSGTNRGFPIQGWDADLFSAIYFGALGLDRASPSRISIHVHIPKRDFSTVILLPTCRGTLRRQGGKLSWVEDQNGCATQRIKVLADQDR